VGFKEGVSKKSEKPYKILELSDGLSSKALSTKLDGSVFSDFKRGDRVICQILVNMFDDYDTFNVIGIDAE